MNGKLERFYPLLFSYLFVATPVVFVKGEALSAITIKEQAPTYVRCPAYVRRK